MGEKDQYQPELELFLLDLFWFCFKNLQQMQFSCKIKLLMEWSDRI